MRRRIRCVVLLSAALLPAACDIPTEPPHFDLTTGVRAPLLVDQTFVLLGPGNTGHVALIDTTTTRFDSIFSVDGSSQTISILQEFDGFGSEVPQDFLPTVDAAPIEVAFTAGDLSASAPDDGPDRSFAFRPAGRSFGQGNSFSIEIPQARLSSSNDFVELNAGTLLIEDIVNEFDVGFDELRVSFSSIRKSPYGPGDSLVVSFDGTTDSPDQLRFRQVERGAGPRTELVDLSGYRLYASGNELSYHVFVRNETSEEERTVRTSERLSLRFRVEGARASGLSAELASLDVPVSSDLNGDGRVDVLDDDEAKVATFETLSVFDELDLGGFQLLGTELRLNVRTNIGADFALYAAVVGTDPDGEPVYLRGRASAAVPSSDPAAPLFVAAGAPLEKRDMIRLEIEGAPSPEQQAERSIVLNESNSNIDAFLSRLPTELRMVAHVVIQPDGGHVQLREPFLLETSFSAAIPLALASGISIDKTFDADLSGLEDVVSDASNASIHEAKLELSYGNGLPLGLDLRVDVLDELGAVAASIPASGQSMRVEPAATDDSGMSIQPADGTVTIGVSRDDLNAMSRGRQIRLRFGLTTEDDGRARIRANDTFTMRLRGSFDVRIRAD